jgi:hypothetical protein
MTRFRGKSLSSSMTRENPLLKLKIIRYGNHLKTIHGGFMDEKM